VLRERRRIEHRGAAVSVETGLACRGRSAALLRVRCGALPQSRGKARVTEDANHDSMSAGVRDLLENRVDSIEALEALLLLRRNVGQALGAEAIAQGLRLPPQHLEDALRRLEHGGLIQREEQAGSAVYTYNPKNEHLAEVVDRLAETYADSPVEIVRVLSVRALERVRAEAAKLFADAFVVRRKNDG
jgi:hypothetical protein